MPVRPRSITSTQRRYRKADSFERRTAFAMRPCSACVSRGLTCLVTADSEHCVECYRSHRRCELTSPMAEVDRLGEKEEKLRSEALALESKVLRLRKQARALRKKMRELGDREE
jgi:hypothetical protein